MEPIKENDECPICMEEIGTTNRCVTKCGHSFCLSCLSRSLRGNNTCPMCREELLKANGDIKEIQRLEERNIILFNISNWCRNEIKKYKVIYERSMMSAQDNQGYLHKKTLENKRLRIRLKIKNLEINEPDNWRMKFRMISKLCTLNLDFKHNFLVNGTREAYNWG